jgi:DnaJ family protein C protein 13
MWREELTRRPLELSEEQACEILQIALEDVRDTSAPASAATSAASAPAVSPEKDGAEGARRVKRKGRVDEEVLKRQYKKMAMKFHPDKNPEGRDQFVAVQAAYERLQASLAGGLQVREVDGKFFAEESLML